MAVANCLLALVTGWHAHRALPQTRASVYKPVIAKTTDAHVHTCASVVCIDIADSLWQEIPVGRAVGNKPESLNVGPGGHGGCKSECVINIYCT